MVRGAPAIAIAAALSLAVEISNSDFKGSPADSAAFLAERLDYLVSRSCSSRNYSRPIKSNQINDVIFGYYFAFV